MHHSNTVTTVIIPRIILPHRHTHTREHARARLKSADTIRRGGNARGGGGKFVSISQHVISQHCMYILQHATCTHTTHNTPASARPANATDACTRVCFVCACAHILYCRDLSSNPHTRCRCRVESLASQVRPRRCRRIAAAAARARECDQLITAPHTHIHTRHQPQSA